MALPLVRGPYATRLEIPLIANDLSGATTCLLRHGNMSWNMSKGNFATHVPVYRGKVVIMSNFGRTGLSIVNNLLFVNHRPASPVAIKEQALATYGSSRPSRNILYGVSERTTTWYVVFGVSFAIHMREYLVLLNIVSFA